MPRPKTISDEQILEVARQCFRNHGHGISTREIAKEVGISQSVLFQRFGGKETMFLRAMMPSPPDVDALLVRENDQSARDYVRAVVLRMVSHFRQVVPALMHLMTYPNFDVAQIGDAHEHLLASTLQSELTARLRCLADAGGIANTSCEAAANALIALAHTAGMHSVIQPVEDASGGQLDQHVDALVDVLWTGMKPRS